jgi:sugar phosphate isomerase/epimerase
MSKFTRREWNTLALCGLAGVTVPAGLKNVMERGISRFNGVQVGVQTYSFRDRPLDNAIDAMVKIGLGSCELWQGHVEPKVLSDNYDKAKGEQARAAAREAIRQWRLSVPLNEFKAVRAKFERAGVELYAYNLSFRDDFTDAEIERGFEMAKSLGVKVITASSSVTTTRRIDPVARRFKIRVGMHNHSDLRDRNEFAAPDSFIRAMQGASDYIAINLDIGHFTAANFDAVEFLKQHHERIVTLHIKDRKRDQGMNTPFGQGDAPIKEVLALLRQNKWSIPANIEYEYEGQDTVQEVKRCLAYCKDALST